MGKFRLLVVFGGQPQLYRSAQWEYVRQMIVECSGEIDFTVVVPDGAVVPSSLPAKVLRSKTDSGYFFYRDIGAAGSDFDGGVVFVAEMAVGVDLATGGHYLSGKPKIPIVVWHHMFTAVTDRRWREATTLFPSLYGSKWDYDQYESWVRKTYTKDRSDKVMSTAGWMNLCGKDLKGLNARSKSVEKYDRPTLLFGCRFNAYHKPDDAIDIMESVYRTGFDFDIKITTPDMGISDDQVRRLRAMGAKIIYQCGPDRFHEILMRSHVGLILGTPSSPVTIPEFVSAGTPIVAEYYHMEFDEMRELEPPYTLHFKSKRRAASQILSVLRNPEKWSRWLSDGKFAEQMIPSMDQSKSSWDIVRFIQGAL